MYVWPSRVQLSNFFEVMVDFCAHASSSEIWITASNLLCWLIITRENSN